MDRLIDVLNHRVSRLEQSVTAHGIHLNWLKKIGIAQATFLAGILLRLIIK